MVEVTEAKLPGSRETGFLVVDVQAPLWIEPDEPVADRPKFRMHFQVPDLECVDDAVHELIDARLGHLDLQAGVMGVCHYRYALPI